jgi:hypothetical protein
LTTELVPGKTARRMWTAINGVKPGQALVWFPRPELKTIPRLGEGVRVVKNYKIVTWNMLCLQGGLHGESTRKHYNDRFPISFIGFRFRGRRVNAINRGKITLENWGFLNLATAPSQRCIIGIAESPTPL